MGLGGDATRGLLSVDWLPFPQGHHVVIGILEAEPIKFEAELATSETHKWVALDAP